MNDTPTITDPCQALTFHVADQIVWCQTHDRPMYACNIDSRDQRLAEIAWIIEPMRTRGLKRLQLTADEAERIYQFAKGAE